MNPIQALDSTGSLERDVSEYSIVADGYGPDSFHRTASLILITDTASADDHPRVANQTTVVSTGSGRGTGSNLNSRVAYSVLNEQTDPLSNVNGGQMDGFQVVHRVGGGAAEGQGVDGGAFLASAQFRNGYFGTLESSVSAVSGTGTPELGVDINIGSVNRPATGGVGDTGGTGFQAIATVGNLTTGLGLGSSASGAWATFIQCSNPDNTNAFRVRTAGADFGGYVGFAVSTVTNLPDSTLTPAGAVMLCTDGNHGEPCMTLNYGGWHIGLDPTAPLVSST